ncbi:protein of unknown function [Caballeronia sp. S22]
MGQVVQNVVHQTLNIDTRAFSTLLSTENVDKSGIGPMRLASAKKWRDPRRSEISARNQETR